jgi:hypothetical protein
LEEEERRREMEGPELCRSSGKSVIWKNLMPDKWVPGRRENQNAQSQPENLREFTGLQMKANTGRVPSSRLSFRINKVVMEEMGVVANETSLVDN